MDVASIFLCVWRIKAITSALSLKVQSFAYFAFSSIDTQTYFRVLRIDSFLHIKSSTETSNSFYLLGEFMNLTGYLQACLLPTLSNLYQFIFYHDTNRLYVHYWLWMFFGVSLCGRRTPFSHKISSRFPSTRIPRLYHPSLTKEGTRNAVIPV